jgi:hypothetical protein
MRGILSIPFLPFSEPLSHPWPFFAVVWLVFNKTIERTTTCIPNEACRLRQLHQVFFLNFALMIAPAACFKEREKQIPRTKTEPFYQLLRTT